MTLVRIRPRGRFGNQVLQYVLAKSLGLRTDGVEITGYNLPDWGLVAPAPPIFPKRAARMRGHLIDLDHAAWLLGRLKPAFLELAGNGCRCEYYAAKRNFSTVFDGSAIDISGFGPEFLVAHVRSGDIFGNIRNDYGVIAPQFYRTLAQRYGKRLVFVGELETNFYIELLRDQFRDAMFIQNARPIVDFEIIRRSKHIVLGASSFSWAAAWLSDAETIDLPVIGFLDPRVRPDMNFLPVDDPRYVFHRFPKTDWFGGSSTPEKLNGPIDSETMTAVEARTLVEEARDRLKLKWEMARTRLAMEVLFWNVARSIYPGRRLLRRLQPRLVERASSIQVRGSGQRPVAHR